MVLAIVLGESCKVWQREGVWPCRCSAVRSALDLMLFVQTRLRDAVEQMYEVAAMLTSPSEQLGPLVPAMQLMALLI